MAAVSVDGEMVGVWDPAPAGSSNLGDILQRFDDRGKKTVRCPVGCGVFLDAADLETLFGRRVELTW